MSFEKNPSMKDKKSPLEKDKIFTFVKEIFDYEVSVGVEKGNNPIRGEINTITKKAEVFITPDGIKKAYEFYKKPETQQKIDEIMEALRQRLEKYVNDGK